jgi:hypothetical protein
MARTLVLAVLAAFSLLVLPGCQSTPENDPSRRGVSTIPWNRPAKWEGGGALGGQMGAMRGY